MTIEEVLKDGKKFIRARVCMADMVGPVRDCISQERMLRKQQLQAVLRYYLRPRVSILDFEKDNLPCFSAKIIDADLGHMFMTSFTIKKSCRASVATEEKGLCSLVYRHNLRATSCKEESTEMKDGDFKVL